MRFPAGLFAAALAQALPLVAASMRWGRPVPAPARWVLGWCGLLVLTDVLSIAVAFGPGANLWLQYGAVPLGSALILWGLSHWQLNALPRLAYRLAIPVLVAATVVALLLLHPEPMFDQVVAPFHALVLLVASLHTLLDRALRTADSISREPWFWIGLGLSLYFAASVAIGPFAQALLASNVDWVRQAYVARAWTSVLAFALITTGILCPHFRPPSGGHS